MQRVACVAGESRGFYAAPLLDYLIEERRTWIETPLRPIAPIDLGKVSERTACQVSVVGMVEPAMPLPADRLVLGVE